MADRLNIDIVNIRDVTQFTPETDVTTMEFYSRKGATNKKIDGAALLTSVLNDTDVGTGFTNISNNASLLTAITELDAVAGGGATAYTNIDLGKFQAIGIAGEVAYAGVAGSGIITLDNPWSLQKADLYIDAATDLSGGNFALTFTITNGTYNTWDGTGTHDLWIPQLQVWDVGPTALTLKQGSAITLGTKVVNPAITWGTNSITFTFLGATDFGTLSRALITIKS